MKNLLFICLILASCSKEAREFDRQTSEKPGRGKGNTSNTTTALLPLTFTQSGTTVQFNWDLPVLVLNEIIYWQWLNREETSPTGQITLLNDGYGIPIQGSEWQSIKTWYQQSVNTYTVTDLKPGYSYRFYVTGSYGPYYDVALTVPYITNIVSITVP